MMLCYINVREHRSGNQKWTIQINWQHRVHNTMKNKTKTQHKRRLPSDYYGIFWWVVNSGI